MKKISAVLILFAITFCSPSGKQAETKPVSNSVAEGISSGTYKLDKSHASLIFKVNHMGFSSYTARFKRFDATLHFDVKDPAKSQVFAIIDPTSLETDYPDSKALDFNAELYGDKWLNAAKFPQIKFRSTKIEMTGANTANIIGELSMHGFKKKVVLAATFNGGYASHPMDKSGARIGFSAKGFLNRSDFGIAYAIPAKGSKMGVSDKVEFILEVEFNKPATKNLKKNP
jgi:polyisoprenoid-binding protein YceI